MQCPITRTVFSIVVMLTTHCYLTVFLMYSNKVLVAYFLFRFLTDRCCYTFMVSGQYSGFQTIQRDILGLELPLIIVRIFASLLPIWWCTTRIIYMYSYFHCFSKFIAFRTRKIQVHTSASLEALSFQYLSQIYRIHSFLFFWLPSKPIKQHAFNVFLSSRT